MRPNGLALLVVNMFVQSSRENSPCTVVVLPVVLPHAHSLRVIPLLHGKITHIYGFSGVNVVAMRCGKMEGAVPDQGPG